jgi:hypothetical protein
MYQTFQFRNFKERDQMEDPDIKDRKKLKCVYPFSEHNAMV